MNEKTTYCQSELLERGWTKKLIEELLPEPKLKKNPKYACASPMKLWDINTVELAEEDSRFKEIEYNSYERRMSALKAIETKRKKTANKVDKAIEKIKVERIPIDLLRTYAIEEKEYWYLSTGQLDRCAYTADAETVNRWMINYVRHNLTEYDTLINAIRGKVGVEEEYYRYREAIQDAIYKVYPELKDNN